MSNVDDSDGDDDDDDGGGDDDGDDDVERFPLHAEQVTESAL